MPRHIEYYNKHAGFFFDYDTVLYEGKTHYQKIKLVHSSEYGHILLLDDIIQVIEKNEWQYHEPMVHVAMLTHHNPQRILIIGGGDGSIAREVLRYSTITHIDFVELDEEVVQFSREHLQFAHHNSFDDTRVHIHYCDGRSFIENSSELYDIIIMDMTDPFGPSKMLYTHEFFTAVSARLKGDESFFVMHSESPVLRPVAYTCIRHTLKSVFAQVHHLYTQIQMYGGLWSIALASRANCSNTLDKAEIHARIYQRQLSSLHMLNAESWHALHCVFPYIAHLHTHKTALITDQSPDFPDNFIAI